MKREAAEQFLRETRDTYDAVAEEFSASRAEFWPELAYLAEHAVPRTKVLDVGCGNGRFYPLLRPRDVHYTGLDYSRNLLAIARSRYPEQTFVEGNATELPFQDGEFDTVFSFATLHHIPSKALRTRAVRELARVLTPGGTLVLSSWDLWQLHYLHALVLSVLRAIALPQTYDVGDLIFTFGKEKRRRYLHAFTTRSLRYLLENNGFHVVGSEIVAHGTNRRNYNIVVVAKKREKGAH